MKLAICVLTILSPVLGWADLAGDWSGVMTTYLAGPHRIVLHVTGADGAMKATTDSPDQGRYNVPIDSITFSGSTLEFSITAYDIKYSGVLNGSGSIVGTFTQHGAGVPLVLTPSAVIPRVMPAADLTAQVANGRYHHDATGVEFDLPSGWSFLRTQFTPSNAGEAAVLKDSSGKAVVATVWMMKSETYPENIAKALSLVIRQEIVMREGKGGGGAQQMAPNYKIRDGSLQQTYIGGHQAVRAIGEYQRGGKSWGELLAWIYTEHTRTYFMVRGAAADLPTLQTSFDQMLQSTEIP